MNTRMTGMMVSMLYSYGGGTMVAIPEKNTKYLPEYFKQRARAVEKFHERWVGVIVIYYIEAMYDPRQHGSIAKSLVEMYVPFILIPTNITRSVIIYTFSENGDEYVQWHKNLADVLPQLSGEVDRDPYSYSPYRGGMNNHKDFRGDRNLYDFPDFHPHTLELQQMMLAKELLL